MTKDKQTISLRAEVPAGESASRLDQIAAKLFPEYSRARLQSWIKDGCLLVDGQRSRPRDSVTPGAALTLDADLVTEDKWVAETLPLDVLFEDEQIIVLNKAAGLVVHPAAGHREGTLLNGLLAHCPELEAIPRAGIVHRLDKDTTGIMVVAKTLKSHAHLVQRLQERKISREYEAVVQSVLTGGGTVDAPLGRHPVSRKKRAVYLEKDSGSRAKPATTHFRVIKRFRAHTHIQAILETGRTHQIRVHMTHLNYPLVGDQMYGGRLKIPAASSAELVETLKSFKRQALHARRLTLTLPDSDENLSWEAPLPTDFTHLLQVLAADMNSGDDK